MPGLLVSMCRGTVAMIWEARFNILGTLVGKASKKYIQPKLKVGRGSNFAFTRVTSKLKPVWKRGIHAPSEGLEAPPSIDRPIVAKYVVQRHFAKRAGEHFDLRFMINGRGISFAIPKHRMPKIGENLLAVLQPDHIEEYFEFKGTIPDGNKGAGKVEIFAAGDADIIDCNSRKIVFELPDGPIAGRYVMINTEGGPRKDHWILRSFPAIIYQAAKPKVSILGSKSESYPSKAAKAFDDGMLMEEKVDGACAGWSVDKEGRLELTGPRLSKRNNLPIRYTHKLPKLVADFKDAGLLLTTGEGELWHKRGPNFVAAVLNSNPERARYLQRKHGPIRMKLFNVNKELPYAERYQILKQVGKNAGPTVEVVKQFNPKSPETAVAFAQWCRINTRTPRDGFVAKDPGAIDINWLKGKPTDTADLNIVGFLEGQKRLKNSLGALRVLRGDREINVGIGFSDYERDWIWRNREELRGECIKVDFHERVNTNLDSTGGRFEGFHESKSEAGLKMYAEALAEGTDKTPREIKHALISAAGWRKK